MTRAASNPIAMLPWLILSVLLHLGAIYWGGTRDWNAPPTPQDALALEPPESLDELRPGIESSDAMVISWIGYDEPTPHSASPADYDQPALTVTSGSPAAEPMVEAPDTRPTPETTVTAEQARETIASAMRILGARAEEGVAVSQQIGRDLRAATDQTLDPLRELLERLLRPATKPQPETLARAEPAETSPAPAQDTQSPSEGGQGDPGVASDRESAPVSIAHVPVEMRELGQPLAAAGLDIRTIRPRFTHYTRLTVHPSDPLIRVEFNKQGDVVSATVLEPSGHKDVDNPILDAVYKWKATGKPLESLDPGRSPATVAIEFRIVL